VRVRLNLATKPLVSHRRFFLGAGAVGVISGLLFIALGWHVYGVRKADAEFRNRSDQIQLEMEQLGEQRAELERFFNLPENAQLHDRAAFLNGVIDARGFNWTRMFMDLERILPGGVHVLSIEPKLEKGSVAVKLNVGAVNDDAKLKLLQALENSGSFSQVQLLSERVPTQPGTDKTIVELTAVYSKI
jgi:type IV pilus assembly protein PilN